MQASITLGTLERPSFVFCPLDELISIRPMFTTYNTFLVTRKEDCGSLHDFATSVPIADFTIVDHIDKDSLLITYKHTYEKIVDINEGRIPCIESAAKGTPPPYGSKWYHIERMFTTTQQTTKFFNNVDALYYLMNEHEGVKVFLVAGISPLTLIYVQKAEESEYMNKIWASAYYNGVVPNKV
jgi:hypothetical protein